jgi:hypothetical protein
MQYTHEVGSILAHLANLKDGYAQANLLVAMYPEVLQNRSVELQPSLRQRKNLLINYTLKCISLHIGPAYK